MGPKKKHSVGFARQSPPLISRGSDKRGADGAQSGSAETSRTQDSESVAEASRSESKQGEESALAEDLAPGTEQSSTAKAKKQSPKKKKGRPVGGHISWDAQGETTRSVRISAPSFSLETGLTEPEETEAAPVKEINEGVERRLVAMFKRQLKYFLLPPRKRRGFVYHLHGEEKGMLDDLTIREDIRSPWMIHPLSAFKNVWDLCMVILSVANVTLVPLNVAYFASVQEERLEWKLFNFVSDLLFLADVVIKFRTGVTVREEHGRINMNADYVARQYRRGLFYVDSFCGLPLDHAALVLMHTGEKGNDPASNSRYPSLLRLNKLLALPKVGRLTTVIRNLANVEENCFVYSTGVYVRLVFNIGMLFLLIHWHGCLQYYVDRLENFPARSWVARMGLQNASWTSRYTWSVYGSTSMMMGVGMGAVEADNTTDSWLRCGCMATGHALQALLVGFCIDMITSMNFTSLRNRQRIRDLDDYMNYKMLPQQLRRRIRNYAENRYKGRVFDEAQIVSELSDPLRERVMWHNSRRLLQNVPFFARADPDFLRDLVSCMQMEFFLPQDVVAAAGTMGDRLYFLQSGSAHVINSEGTTVATVKPGDRFGEVCLMRDTMRVNTVIADSYCRFLSLTRADFDKVLSRHSDIGDLVDEIVMERKLNLARNSCAELAVNVY